MIVSGVLSVQVGDDQLSAVGSFDINWGQPVREAVIGSNGSVVGYREKFTQAPGFEGKIADTEGRVIKKLINITDSTVVITFAQGRKLIFSNAFFCHEGPVLSTEDGQISVKFSARDIDEDPQ